MTGFNTAGGYVIYAGRRWNAAELQRYLAVAARKRLVPVSSRKPAAVPVSSTYAEKAGELYRPR